MNEHKHIIVLNGRHYNAKTGERVAHPGHSAPRPAAPLPHSQRPAAHVAAPAPKPLKPEAKPVTRHSAGHVKAHAPKPSRTLMRHAVRKPAAAQRRIRAQGRLDSQFRQPEIPAPARRISDVRRRTARTSKVHLISHFSPNLFTVTTVVVAQPRTPAPARPSIIARKPLTTADLMDYAVRYADAPSEPQIPTRQKHARRHFTRRAHAHAH